MAAVPPICLFAENAGASGGGISPAAAGVTAFRWHPTAPGGQVEKVTAGTEVSVPVEFDIRGNVPEVAFAVSSEFRYFGIGFEEATSRVRDGKARSRVKFMIPEGMPLGRHDLVIRVLDRRNGTEIGRGSIPFLLLPSDMECLC